MYSSPNQFIAAQFANTPEQLQEFSNCQFFRHESGEITVECKPERYPAVVKALCDCASKFNTPRINVKSGNRSTAIEPPLINQMPKPRPPMPISWVLPQSDDDLCAVTVDSHICLWSSQSFDANSRLGRSWTSINVAPYWLPHELERINQAILKHGYIHEYQYLGFNGQGELIRLTVNGWLAWHNGVPIRLMRTLSREPT
ncbi:hypothetical protein ACQ4M4_12775 [Leptolyngbya sp. AN02str]|uniref:hypothetical protein n=1 Tax=Leptolyngbya sp. AN02str TaxID=3423363 RepID=UPI003D31148B